MTDWWTDGKSRTLINFLVNCPKGTVFLKTIDGSDRVHDVTLIQEMLEDVIVKDIGEKNVIQVCTDNASNYKLAEKWLMEKEGSKLYWMPCAAHCLNLMLADVGKLPLVKGIVKEAQQISIFIYNHKHVLHLMRNETNGREILRPSVTRFATTFLCLQSMYDKHQQLRDMLRRDDWRRSKWPKNKMAIEIVKKIKSSTFWNNMHTCLKIMAPIVDVLRMVDTEEKSSMAYVYSAMEICKAKIKANIGEATLEDHNLWKKMERIVDKRWRDLLQKPLHCAVHYLNPQVYYASVQSSMEIESNQVINEGLLQCIEKLADDEEKETQILSELSTYRSRGARLGKKNAISCLKAMAPVEWWITFGSEVPALQKFATRVLGLTCSASPCEMNWSTFSNIHSKKRNCLEHERLEALAYVKYNRSLKKRYEERISGKPIYPIELKSLDECVEWLVPKDARDDIVLGMDGMTYGEMEDIEDGTNDAPITCSRHNNTTQATSSHTQPQIEDSSEEDDYDDNNFDVEDIGNNDDGIESGTDEDI